MIRFRKDGSLESYIEIPASYRAALAARIKIMCELDISERRKPQDGKIKFKKFGPLDIELRVATIPSAGGVEDIVMRGCDQCSSGYKGRVGWRCCLRRRWRMGC